MILTDCSWDWLARDGGFFSHEKAQKAQGDKGKAFARRSKGLTRIRKGGTKGREQTEDATQPFAEVTQILRFDPNGTWLKRKSLDINVIYVCSATAKRRSRQCTSEGSLPKGFPGVSSAIENGIV